MENNNQQDYQNPQPQNIYYEQNPQPPVQEKVNAGLAVLSYFIPLAGLIIYFTSRKDSPRTAKTCLKCAIASVVINIALIILCFVVMGGAIYSML